MFLNPTACVSHPIRNSSLRAHIEATCTCASAFCALAQNEIDRDQLEDDLSQDLLGLADMDKLKEVGRSEDPHLGVH